MDRCTDYRHEGFWWQQEGKGSCFVSLNQSVVEASPRCVWDSWRRWEVLSMRVSVLGCILCSTTSSRVASCEPATAPAFLNESLGILRFHGCVPAHHSNKDSPETSGASRYIHWRTRASSKPAEAWLTSAAWYVSLLHLYSVYPQCLLAME